MLPVVGGLGGAFPWPPHLHMVDFHCFPNCSCQVDLYICLIYRLHFSVQNIEESNAPLTHGLVLVRISLRKERTVSVTRLMLQSQTTPTSQRLKQRMVLFLFAWVVHLGVWNEQLVGLVSMISSLRDSGRSNLHHLISLVVVSEGRDRSEHPAGFRSSCLEVTHHFCSHVLV